MARLSTHVLDTAKGQPAKGVTIHLYTHPGKDLLKSVKTNQDGRTDEPLLSGDQIPTGTYELIFSAGDYFRAQDQPLPDPPFLDEIVIRFGLSDPTGHYHVPLLLSPYGYSTYRGS